VNYGFLRLLRVADAQRDVVENDLKKLGEFLKQRAMRNKDLAYYTLTYVRKGDVDGYIIVEGEDVENEIEILNGFIESNLTSIRSQIIRYDSRKTINLPIPRTRNFLEGVDM